MRSYTILHIPQIGDEKYRRQNIPHKFENLHVRCVQHILQFIYTKLRNSDLIAITLQILPNISLNSYRQGQIIAALL